MERIFISLACHLGPLFCFFALLPQRILSKSQDYPGEIAHSEKILQLGILELCSLIPEYTQITRNHSNQFHPKDIRHNSPSFPSSHSQAVLFLDLPTLTAGITFHLITHLEKAQHHLQLLPQTYFSLIFLQNT